MNLAALEAAAEATIKALPGGAAVMFQTTFFDATTPVARMIGYADLIFRQPDGRC